MKNSNTFKKATPLLLIAAIAPAMATDVSVPLNFTTLPVITILPIRALDFGAVLSLGAAASCTMSAIDAANGTALTPSQEGADATSYANGDNAENFAGLLSGSCAGGADGAVGIYEITSFQDADISVSVTAGTTTDIAFTPIGYVTDLEDGAGDSFTREPLLIGTPALANASTALSGFSVIGTSRAVIGGTIINQVPLTAGAPYATDFNLNVVYQ
jgi:hypothetical protein